MIFEGSGRLGWKERKRKKETKEANSIENKFFDFLILKNLNGDQSIEVINLKMTNN